VRKEGGPDQSRGNVDGGRVRPEKLERKKKNMWVSGGSEVQWQEGKSVRWRKGRFERLTSEKGPGKNQRLGREVIEWDWRNVRETEPKHRGGVQCAAVKNKRRFQKRGARIF